MPGQQDLWPWLQSIIGNQGAGQPNSPAGMPRYGAGPGNLGMGDPRGLTAPTPGQPSMGYPAMGPLGAPPQPQMPPLPNPLGWAVTPANAAEAGQDQSNPWPRSPWPDINDSSLYERPPQPDQTEPQPAPTPSGPAAYPHMPWPPNADNTHMPWPPGSPAGSPSATPKPVDAAPKGPLASPSVTATPMKRTPGAPNLGYYQPNNRFVQIDRPNASAAGGFGRGGAPQMTALNLAGLFGGGQQPAASPANVPAANAQPVSSPAAPAFSSPGMHIVGPDAPVSADANAPWWMGPLQRGRRWNPNSNDYSP